ncbi:hypothetical protein SLV14_007497 [Streptomyces sp. Je 1-4]|uniref:hypothetical protein n=1 Tax=Streptomyces TaxID=1883 RepID=UPI0021D7DFED|nr:MULTISPECIES: hypothetical protein [unclassified Streptomyces]UYB44410.1 hypothetical protein SLV14_007497 [Streptomyces sp. Je 1-4]UZQ40865.1 hypothetical protein SLV14N_007497 [Streptomyces sp. Je 1-4] [Streptomyces sp. Je 1-4 4N24]UZQ48282.1 hypothetical protein SLV14NA_007497 [Streptomyces sp. Je 1-4] [Streptomyces sp. Je 1-4 4N24_ara]
MGGHVLKALGEAVDGQAPAGVGVEALLRLIEYKKIAGADQGSGKQECLHLSR